MPTDRVYSWSQVVQRYRLSPPDKRKAQRKELGVYTLLRLTHRGTLPSEPVWRWLLPILLLAFAMRVLVALAGDFVLHPDEIMQYLEPAHALVFGSGALHWEFYFGARSWLVPGLVAGVLQVCKWVGLDSPAYYIAVVKIIFCALSLLVPFGMYHVSRALMGEQTGRVALLLGAFWYELAGFAHKPMTEFVGTSLLFLLLYWVFRPASIGAWRSVLIAFVSVLVMAIRFHYIPAVGLVALVAFISVGWRYRLLMVGSGLGFVGLVGVFDYLTWGEFFYSYILNIKVNLELSELARAGESRPLIYFLWLAIASGGIYFVALLSGANFWRRGFLLLLVAVILVPHLFEAHREYRFIYAILPLLLMLFADVLATGLWGKFLQRWQQIIKIGGLSYIGLVSVAGLLNAIPWQDVVYRGFSLEKGRVHFLSGHDKVFDVYRYLAEQPDLHGVLDINHSYFNTGGYYYLHRQVPFYAASTWFQFFQPYKMRDNVSHIVADSWHEITAIVKAPNADAYFAKTKGEYYIPLPKIINDKAVGRLVLWTREGRVYEFSNYKLDKTFGIYTVWKNRDEDAKYNRWESYEIYPDNVQMSQLVQLADKDNVRANQPRLDRGVKLVPPAP